MLISDAGEELKKWERKFYRNFLLTNFLSDFDVRIMSNDLLF